MNEYFVELSILALYLAMVIGTYKGLSWAVYKQFDIDPKGMPLPPLVRWALVLMSICAPSMFVWLLSLVVHALV